MDCFFHHAVPSVARCRECTKFVCAMCRTDAGNCPSCRLAARVDAGAAKRLHGAVGPSRPSVIGPLPARMGVRPESRALVALGYPFWPLALIALIDSSGSRFVRRNAWQALGFNAGMYSIAWLFTTIAAIPLIGISAWPLLPFIVPVTIVASVIYGFQAWHGEDVHVPIVSDFIDKKLTPT